MNKKQYNNVIENTLKYEQTEDSLSTARAIFDNMGVALPQGDVKTVYDIIKTDNYMGWKSCTMQEAQEAADKGTAAIGISEDRIVVLSATDEEQPVSQTASVMTLDENTSAFAVDGLRYYSYSYGGTTVPRNTVTIKKDGIFVNVCFSSGLIWKVIDYDIENNYYDVPQAVWDRYNYNKTKTYSKQQLAYIYLFDPLGIEYYIKNYANHHNIDDIDLLFFKDDVFKEIFGVKPRFFRILPNESIVYFHNYGTITRDFRDSVYSEAEILFGEHVILDVLSIVSFFAELLVDIFTNLPVVSEVLLGIKVYKALFYSGAITGVLSSVASEFLDDYIEEQYEKNALRMFNWANCLLTILPNIVEGIVGPDIEDVPIYNKVSMKNYQTYFEVDENSKISMERIISLSQS